MSACSSASSKASSGTTTSSTTTTTVPAPTVHATVEDGAKDVAVAKPIGVTVEQGTLTKVTLVCDRGRRAEAR